MSGKAERYIDVIKMRLRNYILSEFENLALNEITSGMILKLCRKLEDRGTIETAARVKTLIGQIFRYAIATDRTENDPTIALQNASASRQPKHMATLTKPSDIAMLMKNINAYSRVIVRCALMKRVHIVPLSRQAVELLTKCRQLTGSGRYIFPSSRNDGRPMSDIDSVVINDKI